MNHQHMRVVFRVDSSFLMGSGHLMRCLTLANELRRRGAADIMFISREHSGHLIPRIEEASYSVYRLPAPQEQGSCAPDDYTAWLGVTAEQDAEETLVALSQKDYDWLVVDHYGLGIHWEQRIRSNVRQILIIDDLANRHHDCDVLLDQNYFGAATQERYTRWIPADCKGLFSPRYALLQPEYASLCHLLIPHDGYVYRVLVFFGASDCDDQTGKLLKVLSHSSLAHLIVDVVIGANHPNPERIFAMVAQRPGTTLHQNIPSLAGLMVRADLFIGAGGATTWERMALGLPSLVISIAKNQEEFTRVLSDDGFQFFLAGGKMALEDDWRDAIYQLIQSPGGVANIAQKARKLVDGLGTNRLVDMMYEAKVLDCKRSMPVGESLTFSQNKPQCLRISILSDENTWLLDAIAELKHRWCSEGHSVHWVYDPSDLVGGQICFILGCSQILKPKQMKLHQYNLVVHESELPCGRGWSPMTWQIIEGKNKICVSLFEAVDDLDAGPIYAQHWIDLDGTELCTEWRKKQALVTQALCIEWIAGFPNSALYSRDQCGASSYYLRRRPDDSQLDLDKTLREQFDLLRVVDNQQYPAFFDIYGHRYQLLIEKLT